MGFINRKPCGGRLLHGDSLTFCKLVQNLNIIPRDILKRKTVPGIAGRFPAYVAIKGGGAMYLIILGVYVVVAVVASWLIALAHRR